MDVAFESTAELEQNEERPNALRTRGLLKKTEGLALSRLAALRASAPPW